METKVKKRAWVKNAIIIFLAILLVLTLFSNTIMNHSLPEVSAQYVGGGAITTRIRGTGTIEAVETYDVKATQTRTVQSVPVRVGDQVEVGDVLMYLTGDNSAEVQAAQDELENLETAYRRALLTATSTDYARQNREIENARLSLQEAEQERDKLRPNAAAVQEADNAVATAENGVDAVKQAQAGLKEQIKAAEDDANNYEKEIAAYQKEINAWQKDINAAQKTVDAAQKEVDAAQKEVDAAQAARDAAYSRLAELGGQNNGSIGSDSGVVAAKAALDAAKEALDAARDDLTAKLLLYGADYDLFRGTAEAERGETPLSAYMKYLAEIYSQYAPAEPDERTEEEIAKYAQYEAYNIVTRYQQALETAQQDADNAKAAYDSAQESYYSTYDPGNAEEWNKRKTALDDAETVLKEKNGFLLTKQGARDEAQANVDTMKETLADMEETLREMKEETLAEKNRVTDELRQELADSAEDLADAEAVLQEAKAARSELDTQEQSYKAAEENVRSLQRTLEDLVFSLAEQQKTDSSAQALQAFELNEQKKEIEKKKQELETLKEGGMGQTITAQTAGTVKSISVSAGATTTPDSVLVSIEVSDRGYSLKFPVTLEQSRRVHAGDTAELVDYWWGPEIQATLNSIRPDPSNPQQSRLLVFDITGEEVNVGTQLTLSIGQRSTNYDTVIPSSAIRSDSNGSFVLAVVAKPSPLGNRYIATRVDVTVIASDDTNSAVSGSLSNSDFVITTSTRPVEAGMQVRMAD